MTDIKTIKKPKPSASLWTKWLEISISAANSASFGLIFALRQFFVVFFQEIARHILFPFNAVANIARALVATKEMIEKKYQRRYVVKTIVAYVSGGAVATAIFGMIFAAATFALLTPILSIAGFGLRSLHHALTAAKRFYDAQFETHPENKKWLKQDGYVHLINALSTACNAIGTGLVILALASPFGIIGALGGLVGIASAYIAYQQLKNSPVVPSLPVPQGHSTQKVAKSLGELEVNKPSHQAELTKLLSAAKEVPKSPAVSVEPDEGPYLLIEPIINRKSFF